MDFQPIIAVRCRENGVLIEVLHDDLGLAPVFRPGTPLRAIVEPASVPDVERLLREIHEIGAALDIRLAIGHSAATNSLLASGCRTQRGIELIGARQSLTRESLLREVASQSNAWN